MSDESKVPGGEPAVSASGTEAEIKAQPSPSGTDQKQTVKYDTYAKSLAQEKNLRERLATAEAKVSEAELGRMEAEGKKDEIIDHLKKQNEEMKAKDLKAQAEKADQLISSQVMKAALDSGCVDPELATSLIDVSKLDVNESFQVGTDSLSIALDRLKRDKSYLFGQRKAGIVDAPPLGNGQDLTPEAPKDYSSMDRESAKAAFITNMLNKG